MWWNKIRQKEACSPPQFFSVAQGTVRMGSPLFAEEEEAGLLMAEATCTAPHGAALALALALALYFVPLSTILHLQVGPVPSAVRMYW